MTVLHSPKRKNVLLGGWIGEVSVHSPWFCLKKRQGDDVADVLVPAPGNRTPSEIIFGQSGNSHSNIPVSTLYNDPPGWDPPMADAPYKPTLHGDSSPATVSDVLRASTFSRRRCPTRRQHLVAPGHCVRL